jgi:chromosome segregation and condensation protein ScpB
VLLVVIGYRQKGGVSIARVGEILGLDASSILDDLLSQGLIYCDPSRELSFWRPTSEALLALGLRSHTDIPEPVDSNTRSISARILMSRSRAADRSLCG